MEQQTVKELEFKKGYEAITLDELKSSIKAEELGGLPKSRPVEHYVAIENVCEILDKANISFTVDKIFCAGGSSTKKIKAVQNIYGDKAIEAHLMTKIIARIMITTLANDENNACIGISYHQRGICYAYGSNVVACSNMSILGGNMVSTYGNDKMGFDHMVQVIENWAGKFETLRTHELEMIEKMKQREVSNDDTLKLQAMLHRAALMSNMDSKIPAPLNVTQVNRFAEGLIKNEQKGIAVNNAWDLYNVGTNILKPKHADIATIFEQAKDLGDFIIDKYQIN